MDFCILGPLEVLERGRSLALGGRKQRTLLAVLLLHAGEAVSTDRLVDELWGERPPATAAKLVQGYVAALRKLLPAGVLVTRAPGYVVGLDGIAHSLDLHRFERLTAAAQDAAPERAVGLLREALALWRGPALGDIRFGGLAASEAAALEDSRLVVLTQRIELELTLGRHADLVGELESLVAEHPFQERLRSQLMLALYRSGRQAEALEVYGKARTTLDELGIEPSDELRRLEKQILTHDAALTPTQRQTNLPAQPTPLVGRGSELANVLALLRANTLVTLTGAGGSGKTRLALAAADELLADFADGVWFVSLASLTDPELAEATIAHALGARGELTDFLRSKQLLLLLDNLEQLLPKVARIVAGLDARILATSRERLNLTEEQEYPVPTLPLNDAVALFTQRARQLKPRFEPDEHVAEIARRLDGLPLALELAAARVKVLTPAQIVERLGKSLDLLSGGGHDRPPRQRTLRATLQWSHNLLSDGEQRLFARLGIFAGSFDLVSAETIAQAELDSLQSLLDKSLLTSIGDNRFTMLDTLRTFAREHLDAAELETLRRRQLQLLKRIAERSPFFIAATAFSAQEQLVWLDQVEPMLPDIREVLAWALARDPARAGLLVCRLSTGFLLRGGGGHEARTWLERLLQERPALPDEVLAEALARLGDSRLHAHDLEAAAALRREGIDLYRRLGNRMMAAWATNGYAATLRYQGAYADALALHERALADFRDLGNQAMVALTLYSIGDTLIRLGYFDRARETLRQAIATAESYGGDVVFILTSLAGLELEQRNLDDAEVLYLRAYNSARDMNHRFLVAYCLAGLACIAALRGDTEDAGERWGRVERIEDEIGERLHRWDRETYEHIMEPLANDAAFRRGYEAGRTAGTAFLGPPAGSTRV